MKKIFCLVLMGAVVLSCSENKKTEIKENQVQMEKVEYTYSDKGQDYKVSITTPPKRAVLFTPHMTEMLLALGLEESIVMGTTEGPVYPMFAEAYEKVPYREIGHSFKKGKEAFLLMEPDFVSGDVLEAERTGSVEDLLANGINPFLLKTVGTTNATLETVYEDFHMLGKIFNVNDKAKEVVEGMKNKLTEAQKTFVKPENPKKVMFVSSYNNGAWVYASLASDLAKRANAINIYEDVDNQYEFVSYESVVHRNPDVIFITDTESRGMSLEEKADFLRQHPILKNINAVKNNQIYSINFADVTPGVRNVDFVIRMHKILYQGGK